MPLSKRRRLFTPRKGAKLKPTSREQHVDNEVTTARGRLKGALMEMMEPTAEESDASSDYIPAKRDRNTSQEQREHSPEEDEKSTKCRKSPQRQSYVLKLFDRSVDLSQFTEDSPLYPICRAWIANQPKINYSDYCKQQDEPKSDDTIDLPGPEGPAISRIPSLLPVQKACSKDNINLNYREAPPPGKEQLLRQHAARWAGVRGAWLRRAARVEARYGRAQAVLNKINHNNL